MLPEEQRSLEVLLGIALDLTASLAAADRYNRLLAGVRRVVPCDAACLLRLEGTHLVPVAGFGLSPARWRAATTGAITRGSRSCSASRAPVRFPPDSLLADPFDGVVVGGRRALRATSTRASGVR